MTPVFPAMLVAAVALVSAMPAAAQVSAEVSPLRVELKLGPGGTHTQAITITNNGKEPIRVRATVSDWFLSQDGAPQFQEPEDGRAYSASAWMRVAPPELVIQPNADGTVRFNLAVPKDVEPAGYRTGILFDLLPATADPVAANRRQVIVRNRIATLIYATVGQPRAGAVDLTDLRSQRRGEQLAIVATLKNTSGATLRTKGTLAVHGAGGVVVREVPVPDVPLLPESERDVAIVVSEDKTKPLPPGDYRIELKIDVGLSALIVGETTLKIAK